MTLSAETIDLSPDAPPEEGLAASAWELVRRRAERATADPEILAGLDTLGDAATLVSQGLVEAAKASDNPDQYLLTSLPVLWWLHYHTGVDAIAPLTADLDPTRTPELAEQATRLLESLDSGERPAAWHRGLDRVSLLAESVDDVPDKSRVLARGLALTIHLTGGTLAPALGFLQRRASLDLCRAVCLEPRLANHVPWLSALIFRGDQRTRAIAACSLATSASDTAIQLQSVVALAPLPELVHIADVHGLLGLLDHTERVQETLRTAVLTRIWQGEDVSGNPWWDAFRGEDFVVRLLPECGEQMLPVARGMLESLPVLALSGDDLADAPRSDALAHALALTLSSAPDFDSPLRRAEAALRDRNRMGGDASVGRAMRAYASVLVRAGQDIVHRGERGTAKALYARVVRMRRAYPQALPKDLFPDDLDRAVESSEAASARRWALREAEAPAADELVTVPKAQHDDPLPDAREVVAAVGSGQPLPRTTARWAGALGWNLTTLLTLWLPLPVRYLMLRVARLLGCTPRVRFLLSDEGRGAICTEYRVFGLVWRRRRRSIAGGRLFLFPVENVTADRLLGRWAALLLLVGTVGTWLALRASTTTAAVLASGAVAVVLLGYFGAVGLHRRLGTGLAVAVRDSDDHVTVWAIDHETRYLLERHADRSQRPGVAELAAASQAPEPVAAAV